MVLYIYVSLLDRGLNRFTAVTWISLNLMVSVCIVDNYTYMGPFAPPIHIRC